MDITKIIVMFDYFVRYLHDMFNKILKNMGKNEIEGNSYEFTTKDILS